MLSIVHRPESIVSLPSGDLPVEPKRRHTMSAKIRQIFVEVAETECFTFAKSPLTSSLKMNFDNRFTQELPGDVIHAGFDAVARGR
jgi:hypothetical protein